MNKAMSHYFLSTQPFLCFFIKVNFINSSSLFWILHSYFWKCFCVTGMKLFLRYCKVARPDQIWFSTSWGKEKKKRHTGKLKWVFRIKNLSGFIHLEMKGKKYFNRTWTVFYFLIRNVITVLTPFETVNEKSSSLWSNFFSDYARS